jgi:arogenate/prephenate dehydratase
LGVALENVDDTASAAKFIATHNHRDTGAVASARAAEIYGLDILLNGIQDDFYNVTRFLMLARDPIIPRTDRPFKTSIVFTVEDRPGAIFKALAVFALRNINLTKIEGRPQRKRPLRVLDDSSCGTAKYFDYLFYIDFEASMADLRAQHALGHLQEFATFLRVLGSYPIDMTPVNRPAAS